MANIIKFGGAGINKKTTGTYKKGVNYVMPVQKIGSATTKEVCYVNGKYFVASTYSPYIIYYSDDGMNWTAGTGYSGYSNKYLINMWYVNGKYVTYNSSNEGAVYYSTDGVTWTFAASKVDGDMIYAGGAFMFADNSTSSKNSYIKRSTDAVNWSTVFSSSDPLYMASAGNKIFVRHEYTTPYSLYCSSDYGATFTKVLSLGYAYYNPSYVNGKYFVSTKASSKLSFYLNYSNDGITWTVTTSTFSYPSYIIYAFNKWWYVSSSAYYSTNGATWTLSASSIGTVLYYSDDIIITTSHVCADGVTWTAHTTFASLATNGNIFVACYVSSSIYYALYSYDGVTWTQSYAGTDVVSSVKCFNNKFFASTKMSEDGKTWENIATVPTAYVGDMYYSYYQDASLSDKFFLIGS